MKLYNIRYYRPEDRPRLIQFLDKYWRKNHIISTSDILFDFQHRVEDRYTFVVAENKETEEFDGVYGYILTHKYDTSHAIPNVAWGAIWKVRSDVKSCEIGSLGLGLLKFIIKNENILTFASSGIIFPLHDYSCLRARRYFITRRTTSSAGSSTMNFFSLSNVITVSGVVSIV